MKTFQSFFVTISLFFFGFMIATPASAAPNEPVPLLKYIADNMIAGLKANKATLKSKPTVVFNLAYTYVVPYANLAEMSRNVLPPHIWRSASEAQKTKFQKLFASTVIRTYAAALSNYNDQTVRFFPLRGKANGNTIVVKSQIISSQRSPIDVTYRLIRVQGKWKLYDMSVEGVSMLESFREQFSALLSQGNMNSLLNRLAAHNQQS